VVTTIILLILAGVTLHWVIGANSIIEKSTKAVDATELAKFKENFELSKTEALMDMYMSGDGVNNTLYNYVTSSINESENNKYKTSQGIYTIQDGELIYTDEITKLQAKLEEDENGDLIIKEIITGEMQEPEKPEPEKPITKPEIETTVEMEETTGKVTVTNDDISDIYYIIDENSENYDINTQFTADMLTKYTEPVSVNSGSTIYIFRWDGNKISDVKSILVVKTSLVSYNLNGGTDGPVNKEYAYLSSVPLTPYPTRVGYTFKGWSTTAEGEVVYNTSIETFEMPSTEVNLYAVWEPIMAEYKVEHYRMDTNGNYPSSPTATQTLRGTTNAGLTLANLAQKSTGFSYSYGQVDGSTVENTTIAVDGSRIIKLYYTRNKYRFTLENEYAIVNTTGSTQTSDVYYGATITLKGTLLSGYAGNIEWVEYIDRTDNGANWQTHDITSSGVTTSVVMPNKNFTITIRTEAKAKLVNIITASNYGDSVTYSANGVTNWKIFYKDSLYVYLIAGEYVPNSGINTSATGIGKKGNYEVYWANVPSSLQTATNFFTPNYKLNNSYANSRCVSTLLNTSNWTAYANGKSGSKNIVGTAIGGPSVEMLCASWNAKGYTPVYCNQKNTYGSLVGTTTSSTTPVVNVSSSSGYNDILYFPHKTYWNGVWSMWLATPSGVGPQYIVLGSGAAGGLVGTSTEYPYTSFERGLRPIVRLPLGVNTTSTSAPWNLVN